VSSSEDGERPEEFPEKREEVNPSRRVRDQGSERGNQGRAVTVKGEEVLMSAWSPLVKEESSATISEKGA
jgi:hypothetical protein